MKTYNYPFVKSVVVCGDIHGEFENLVYQCCVQYKLRDTLIIVAGDCGFGFDNHINTTEGIVPLLRRLIRANCWLAFVRGNHDNPAYFDGEHFSDADRFGTIPDYSILTACGHQILCVGGAVSIDRDNRTDGKDWWMNEGPALRPDLMAEIARKGFRIDMVVTHTAPSFCEFVTPPAGIDAMLLADIRHERDVMDGLLAHLHHDGHPLRRWFYGHFHSSWNAELDGVVFTMLNCMELKQLL